MSGTSPSNFIAKVFEIFSDPKNSDMCGWNQQGQTIFVSKIEQFSRLVLPRYFRHSNFQSFVRQLNMYSFRKTIQDPKHGEFEHPNFKQANPERLVYIKRKLNSNSPTLLRAKAAAAAAAAAEAAENPVAASLMIPAKSASRKSKVHLPVPPPTASNPLEAAAVAVTPASLPDGIAARSNPAVPVSGSPVVERSSFRPQNSLQQVAQQRNMFTAASIHNPLLKSEYIKSEQYSFCGQESRFVSDQFDVDADDFDSLSVKNENGKRNANESSLATKRSLVEEAELDIDLELLMSMSVDDNVNDSFLEDGDLGLEFDSELSSELLMTLSELDDSSKTAEACAPQTGVTDMGMSAIMRDAQRSMIAASSPIFPSLPGRHASPAQAVSPVSSSSQLFSWGEGLLSRKDSFSSRSFLGESISRSNSIVDWDVAGFLDVDFDAQCESSDNAGLMQL